MLGTLFSRKPHARGNAGPGDAAAGPGNEGEEHGSAPEKPRHCKERGQRRGTGLGARRHQCEGASVTPLLHGLERDQNTPS